MAIVAIDVKGVAVCHPPRIGGVGIRGGYG